MKMRAGAQLVTRERENQFRNLCDHRDDLLLQQKLAMALGLRQTALLLVEIASDLWPKERARGKLQLLHR